MKVVKSVTGEERAMLYSMVNLAPEGMTIDEGLALQGLIVTIKGDVRFMPGNREYDFQALFPSDLFFKESELTILLGKFPKAKWLSFEVSMKAKDLKEKLEGAVGPLETKDG